MLKPKKTVKPDGKTYKSVKAIITRVYVVPEGYFFRECTDGTYKLFDENNSTSLEYLSWEAWKMEEFLQEKLIELYDR